MTADGSNWILVSERLPERRYEPVIVYSDKYGRELGVLNNRNLFIELDGGEERAVTHWQPLPDPPNKEGT